MDRNATGSGTNNINVSAASTILKTWYWATSCDCSTGPSSLHPRRRERPRDCADNASARNGHAKGTHELSRGVLRLTVGERPSHRGEREIGRERDALREQV